MRSLIQWKRQVILAQSPTATDKWAKASCLLGSLLDVSSLAGHSLAEGCQGRQMGGAPARDQGPLPLSADPFQPPVCGTLCVGHVLYAQALLLALQHGHSALRTLCHGVYMAPPGMPATSSNAVSVAILLCIHVQHMTAYMYIGFRRSVCATNRVRWQVCSATIPHASDGGTWRDDDWR